MNLCALLKAEIIKKKKKKKNSQPLKWQKKVIFALLKPSKLISRKIWVTREINFEDSTTAKSAINTHFKTLNLDFYEFLHFLNARNLPNKRKLQPLKWQKTPVFKLLAPSDLISRKIWLIENSWNVHIVYIPSMDNLAHPKSFQTIGAKLMAMGLLVRIAIPMRIPRNRKCWDFVGVRSSAFNRYLSL